MGHEVIVSAEDGRNLITGCRAQVPDVIITDIRMPGMDGIDAAGQLCNERSVPVIVVSSRDATELEQRIGCEHVVNFSHQAEQLATVISEVAKGDVGALRSGLDMQVG